MVSNRSGSTFQGAVLAILAFVILGLGVILYFHRMSTRPASPATGDAAGARYAAEEQKALESWQAKIADSQSQLLVLKHENERLKGKDQ